MRLRKKDIQFLWTRDTPEEVAGSMMQLAANLDDFREPLFAAAAMLQEEMEVRFKTGTDVQGKEWADWTEEYRKVAELKNRKVFADRASLQKDGELYDSIRSFSSTGVAPHWRITEHELFLDTSGWDDKWPWHNFGRLGRRHKDGTPNPLKQRQFVGASDAAQGVILANFGAWLDGEVRVATSAKGRPFFRHAKQGVHPVTGHKGFIPR